MGGTQRDRLADTLHTPLCPSCPFAERFANRDLDVDLELEASRAKVAEYTDIAAQRLQQEVLTL